jgi:hypothetical protein
MAIVLSILSKLCFAWIIAHVIFSFRSATWAGQRHYQALLFLEFKPHRARGHKETARARLLTRMGLCTLLALPIGIALLIASVAIS